MSVLTAFIYKEEDMYIAECLQVGTVSQGKTIEEALENLKEATELYIEEFPIVTDIHPIIITFEVSTKGEDKTAKV
ncbi:MAG: type II toxin-antitoxin system HicB family antitoxin [Candidatus Helarchaeota archaeon]